MSAFIFLLNILAIATYFFRPARLVRWNAASRSEATSAA